MIGTIGVSILTAQICGFCKHEQEDCYCSPNSVCDKYEQKSEGYATLYIPRIKNGSKLSIGGTIRTGNLMVDQHFNWFQKLMWKWCFGVRVEDYSEE